MADLTNQRIDPAMARRNKRVAVIGLSIAIGMVGLAYASVPLYNIFCQVTGFGGTPGKATDNPKGIIDRIMTVRFDSNVANDLSWSVKAAPSITDNIGAVDTVNYIATNLSDKPLTGMATFNVSPERAGVYFNKIECFCFTEQTLQPGETVEMPIVFFVDPELNDNPELNTIKEITLSYTFYASENGGS
ncbi:cytochrome C oxidase assembly protein [Devosia epidermidihirudinis]|uniref:Cytochrome c oxidase assembly protein CtaG n=1 Tax=Devosia epidermidihirudinis TaxID=1293439 RepID=A0A0F5QMI9_9HYPH|nr:cytochrome c oxidase assembly protein [Devosia epidermidihirudinis]KKC41254.1 cytochrome C oxidase assembly protein [Devosia epidermidihirudinis]KKC41270.1 cytochrome C oxidase assembly protein [Devosia epidermidihirudinis]